MSGSGAKTEIKPEHRAQQEGELQPEVSRQFDDAPVSDLVKPQSQAGAGALPEEEAHPNAGVSKHINTGGDASAQRGN